MMHSLKPLSSYAEVRFGLDPYIIRDRERIQNENQSAISLFSPISATIAFRISLFQAPGRGFDFPRYSRAIKMHAGYSLAS